MKINEIFYSIQGEGTNVGKPCIFIRTSGCNLNCSWCDTKYHNEGKEMSIKEIISEIENYKCNLVEITGGEPFLQKAILELVDVLIALDYEITVETNGTQLLMEEVCDAVKLIVDIKCPSSGNKWDRSINYFDVDILTKNDEIKFVVATDEDLEFSTKFIKQFLTSFSGAILYSPVFDKMDLNKLVNHVKNLNDDRVRMQIQLHKIIWGNKKGV
jgi:7-carboxy-7-deazaguanine synthase